MADLRAAVRVCVLVVVLVDSRSSFVPPEVQSARGYTDQVQKDRSVKK